MDEGHRIALAQGACAALSDMKNFRRKGVDMRPKQDVRQNSKKQSRTRNNAKASVGSKGSILMDIEQILIGEGILTRGSDREAIAKALGLSDRRFYENGN